MLPMRPSTHAGGMTRGYSHGVSAPPHHLFFLLIIAVLFMMFSWYMRYESTYESVMDQLKLFLMASPVIILLAVHWLSAAEKPSFPFAHAEPNTIHRAGSSPWGVGLLLVFLMFVISYQSELQDRTWFPVWRSGRSSRRY
uniref:Uncharacterized protein n=1 Tax=Picea sitchensis TaxID=3332 RepID=B8LM81_PICSI|nr:unknown [Picea sitchensis]